FDSTAAGGLDAGYLVGGTGWYRKSFLVPADTRDKHFILQFDGIYMNSDVWLNGTHLGQHPYGYTSFRYDITDILKPGKTNTLAVRVRNEGHNSRWYSGSGIYRHVHIYAFNPVHLDPWFVHVTTPVVNEKEAVINISASVFNETGNQDSLLLVTTISDSTGKVLSEKELNVDAGEQKQKEVNNEVSLYDPLLWSPDSPYLYSFTNKLYSINDKGDRMLLDSLSAKWGIRSIDISPEKGFVLNGIPIELKGGCMHHDNGPLGAAAFDRAEERRVELMKASGFNAIRCSHNPPSPAFLDACDRLGMMIIDESFDMWSKPKNPDDYHLYFAEWWKRDLESMVRRDRNHPSVVLWSIGNEIPERNTPEGVKLAKQQYDFVKSIDSSRMITSAVNSLSPDKDPYFAVLDVAGYNYAVDKYKSDHTRVPGRRILCTESFPLEAFNYWMGAVDNSWVTGDFVWTGFDYLGEASIGWLGYPHDRNFYPWNHAYCGDIDICGFKRPQSYYRDILWNNGKQISIFVKPPVSSFPMNDHKAEWSKWEWQDVTDSWTWPGQEGKNLEIEVYSSSPEVELLLNDKSFGKKNNNRSNQWLTKWNVPYQSGRLLARGVDASGRIIESELRTAGESSILKLLTDRSSIKSGGQYLAYITVMLTDKDGVINPLASDKISFEISGPGKIQATGSSDPRSDESFTDPYRKAYKGRCIVIIRSGKERGEIVLKASSEHAGSSEIKITCN
ncbi:MAG TPA: glycoside hydrolase family 2 TIM barrel-domain containing protein, partial [Bacteroidales bacterium]|nr:glycoside hydrolase family 2 TIM barrel-domain containing protein [Bacteroidales bacterium]